MTRSTRMTPAMSRSRLFIAFLVLASLAWVAFPRTSMPRANDKSASHKTKHNSAQSGITVHEWGTFTSIAGPDGLAMTWLPLIGSSDLPQFVEHLQNADFKGGLRGTIRMETPVLYFYSSEPATVSVRASFSHGLITEWYPHATVPALNPRTDFSLGQKRTAGSIIWNSVQIQPGLPAQFPADETENHYYAARQTASVPLAVNASGSTQYERFLFYRGVSAVLPPLTAASSEHNVSLKNHASDTIPTVVLFERRGANIGYSILGPLKDEASVAMPSLDASLDALFSDLEGLLISQGLYPDEAHAMLETWKASWFEEGCRVLYIIPRSFVDRVLPLSITPTPQETTRVFVGRLELITPRTQQSVTTAFATNDTALLATYGRFLEPILSSLIESAPDPATRQRYISYLNSAYAYSRSNLKPAN